MDAHTRSFDEADEVIVLPGLRSDVVSVGALGVARTVHQPGWRWSDDVRPSVGTAWCETRHVGYCLRGRAGVELEDGSSFEIGAGDVFDIPPRHDGWVVGDEPYETIEWLGARSWLAQHSTLHERVLATLVFTDIVASTAAAHRLGESAWGDLLASYENGMRDVIGTYRGRIVKFTGDGLLAVFDGTSRALRGAVAMRTAADDLGLATRTAVHTGEIELAGDDVHGLVVHETARMLGVASEGEILVSSATRALAEGAGMTFEDRGVYDLRDLTGLRNLFALR